VDAWELYQKIQQSEGMKIHWRMQELQASFSIFSGNLEEMLEFGSLIEQLYSSLNLERKRRSNPFTQLTGGCITSSLARTRSLITPGFW
jgi:hypothetical protein